MSKKDMRLVGLVGSAGVGKSTIANYFQKYHQYMIIPFAKPLKAALVTLTGLSMDNFTNIDLKERTIKGLSDSPRTLMQKFGTDFVREMISPDFWLWRMRNELEGERNYSIIIDDIRFDNEAQLVRYMGGVVIHLQRSFESPTVHNKHASEQQDVVPKLGDYIVSGNKTPDETYNVVSRYINEFYAKGDKNG